MKSASISMLLLGVGTASAVAQVDPSAFATMKARSIGPAGMSGRVAAVDAVASNPNVIYVGAATGGVWKSADGGLTWQPVFDDQPASSVGAVAVFQANPDVVWVGTGEGNPRNSAGVGNGVYKSLDAGRTWQHLGLERSERIHRIVLHPTNPDVAYLAVLGPTWRDGDERGVFKTTDAGRTWVNVLHVNERTGAADLIMDPSNPNKLFAAMWEHRRWPWFFESGGPGSGLHVTYDGGETWRRLTHEDGLPQGELGRIGLGISYNAPGVVYALVEATQSALLRSDDGGTSWETISDERGIVPRPFYYADLRVDPTNENRIYSLHGRITVSEDQGRNFETVVPSSKIHGDVHELWIHPENGRFLIMGNDGGIGISYDRGKTWRFVENLPLAQFYHINVDMDIPYNVYGGLQDNGSWFGPSSLWHAGGIRNYYWTRVGGGDGFATFTDFGDDRYGYSMSQQAFLQRFDKVTGQRKDIRPVHPGGTALRFNWNAAFNIDPFDSTVIYLGSQFVHRTRDRGDSWEILSDDLTTNDPQKQRSYESGGLSRDASGAENHTTIITVAPSPVERGVIWVGTDDGNVQISRDDGASWTNVRGRFGNNVPEHTWVPHIEPSKFDGATAFVVFDDHRRGNWTTYAFETTDYGQSWRSIATDDIDGFVHVIEQDPVEPAVLYLGTEFGMYVSLNGGESWFKWTHGLPTAPYRALLVHPRDHDLVMGTHGRGVYILDDVRPLREIARNPAVMDAPLHLFTVPPTYQHHVAEAVGYRSTGDAMFFGENRPYGALITYAVAREEGGGIEDQEIEIEILDGAGEVIRTMSGPRENGLNRMAWNLRRNGFRRPTVADDDDDADVSGPEVVPGTYTVHINSGDVNVTAPVEVLPDPRTQIAEAERRQKLAAILQAGQRLEVAAEVVHRIGTTREAIATVATALEQREPETAAALVEEGEQLRERLKAVADRIVSQPTGQGLFNTSHLLGSRLRSIYSSLQSSWDAPTEAQRIAMQQTEGALQEVLDELNALVAGEVTEFRRRAEDLGLDLIRATEPLTIDWVPAMRN